jgi:hypothetical protein
MAVPYYDASAVAGLIGANPYRSADEALLEVLARRPAWRAVIEEARTRRGVLTEAEVLAASGADLEAPVAAACVAVSDAEVRVALDAASEQTKRSALDAGMSPEAAAAAAEVAVQAVTKERGRRMEASVLDSLPAKISQRNTVMRYYRCPEFSIGGRIDGWDEEAGMVIEVKTRRRWWATPPAYDICQLQVYQRIHGGVPGRLVEHMPGGHIRETVQPWDEEAWLALEARIKAVAARERAMTKEQVEALVAACW